MCAVSIVKDQLDSLGKYILEDGVQTVCALLVTGLFSNLMWLKWHVCDTGAC